MSEIHKTHPRYASLELRERLVAGFQSGLVAPQGLIAHGRGEMFYYLLGERTTKEARVATKAGAALLLGAEHPVISVNGNVAALCPGDVVRLADATGARIEVGLFHRSDDRLTKIQAVLEEHGATEVLGFLPDASIPALEGPRGMCTHDGIFTADVVVVPLEDGDRAEALVRMGKKTIAVDLNPMSRTSRMSTVSIVDEVTHALPGLVSCVEDMDGDSEECERALSKYDRDENLRQVMARIGENLAGR